MVLYILNDNKEPVPCDVYLWAAWRIENEGSMRVARTEFTNGRTVSTVFLGVDHNYFGKGPPILFETVVFASGKPEGEYTQRYATWAEAEVGHMEIVELFTSKGHVNAR